MVMSPNPACAPENGSGSMDVYGTEIVVLKAPLATSVTRPN